MSAAEAQGGLSVFAKIPKVESSYTRSSATGMEGHHVFQRVCPKMRLGIPRPGGMRATVQGVYAAFSFFAASYPPAVCRRTGPENH